MVPAVQISLLLTCPYNLNILVNDNSVPISFHISYQALVATFPNQVVFTKASVILLFFNNVIYRYVISKYKSLFKSRPTVQELMLNDWELYGNIVEGPLVTVYTTAAMISIQRVLLGLVDFLQSSTATMSSFVSLTFDLSIHLNEYSQLKNHEFYKRSTICIISLDNSISIV